MAEIAVCFDEPVNRGTHWTCAFQIDWPSGPARKEAAGLDSVQALLLAFEMAGTLLYVSTYHRERRLWWERPGGGYGFPVPKGLQDVLEGDDR